MNKTDMTVRIARAEGMMLALYGLCRDLVIGCSVDEDKDGGLGACVDVIAKGLREVYGELSADAGGVKLEVSGMDKIRIPGWMRRAANADKPSAEDDEDRP